MTQQIVEQKAKEMYQRNYTFLENNLSYYTDVDQEKTKRFIKAKAKILCDSEIDAMIEAQMEVYKSLGNETYDVSEQYAILLDIKDFIKNKI